MSDAIFILLSAVFLAVPVLIKYTLAFQMRHWVYQMRQRERAVQRLGAKLEAVESECIVMGRALRQIELAQRHALGRKTRVQERLARERKQDAVAPHGGAPVS